MENVKNAVPVLIYLAACAVNNIKPVLSGFDALNLEELFEIASFHKLSALVNCALEDTDIRDNRFIQARMNAVRRELIFDSERTKILKALDSAEIWYMPLKGVILKDYYPQIGTREMSDNDILFDEERAEDVREIMLSLGYTVIHYGKGHQDDYQKPPVSHFEMHRSLFSAETEHRPAYGYYQNVKDRLIKDHGNRSGYHFSAEDFYIYMVAHEYKHFIWRGTGLRSLLDVYLYLSHNESKMDWDYIFREMEKLEITDFEKKNRSLAMKVFTDGRLQTMTLEERSFLEYFINSGAYGSLENRISMRIRHYGKLMYFFRRVWIPMNTVREYYPVFYRYKILLPLLPFYRLFRKRRIAIYEIKHLLKN